MIYVNMFEDKNIKTVICIKFLLLGILRKKIEENLMENKPVLLIGFYNTKALGVRYLERSLVKAGFKVYTLFLKDFNSKKPESITQSELILLKYLITTLEPGLIGMSVMSSLYLETITSVNKALHENFNIPIVWGGVIASLFPENCLEHADFVLRGEGEAAIIDLAEAVLKGKPYSNISNLAYKNPPGLAGSGMVINELRPLVESLDDLGYPLLNLDNKYFIKEDQLLTEDPLLKSISYELSASRGCPFTCSYCSSVNLKRMYRGSGRYVRFRSVASIIQELEEALSLIKDLKIIHFWDEIFPDQKEWIDEFSYEYKKRIKLPFEIWGHPLKTDEYTISKLVDAGLYKVVMGIQSGSPSIRRDIFHRRETQEDILEAGRILSRQKVPQVVFDFMLRHPFEKEEDIRLTYELCTKLARPFELQLHGLSFLPGTDIIDIGISEGITGIRQLEAEFNSSMLEQYKIYWGHDSSNNLLNYWYSLIYISQFKLGLIFSQYLHRASKSGLTSLLVLYLSKLYRPLERFRYLRKKTALLVRAEAARIRLAISRKQVLQVNEEN